MDILILIIVEIVKAVVREVVTYSIKVFADKKRKNEKTTRKLRKSKKGGRSRK
ncbi:hypothetical protein [Bacillus cereus group sp. TH152-1LC]|uniref:hypothetical protein n=1 Tax=Bacillus cereus group sp. TH152-1LC TaxID=3018060 RepID=UPI0022E6C82C|nr:hypothetical protein [Bacillus cereus group sp. TH152-1LC]MDA1675321.1 hypothetical protein [Bacillus cereus group sp. TH152-1LC]